MDDSSQNIDSKILLEQGEELLDSSRRLLAEMEGVLIDLTDETSEPSGRGVPDRG